MRRDCCPTMPTWENDCQIARTYVRDSGLLHALLGITDLNELSGHPVVGKSWEGFVIESLLSVAPERTQSFFYATAAEVDLH